MISPKVTTLGIGLIHARARATLATMRSAFARSTAKLPASIALASSQRAADADRDGAGVDPVAGVVERDAAGRHQLDVRQRRADVLDVTRTERRRRKHLDDVGARVPGVEDLGRREAARRHRHVAAVTRLDDVTPEDWADDELRARRRSP